MGMPEHAPNGSVSSREEKQDGTLDVIGHKSSVDEAKLLRKIDLRVVPILTTIYFAAFLDRINISNALTLSLPKDLHLTGQQPNIALTVFFVPYIILEIPSNVLMKKVSPHLWLSGCIFAFGIVMLGQGFVKSYGGLIATRFFLGFFEAGILPGAFYLMSFWYTREESLKRFSVFWMSTVLAGAFGSLIASGIAKMDGLQGLASWRWIFILEGLFTIAVGFLSFFVVADFPSGAKWLTPEERAFILAKTEEDAGAKEKFTKEGVIAFFSDIKNHLAVVMYFTFIIPAYSVAYFLPTIIQGLGYSTIQTQLHSVPPWAACFGYCILIAVLSDRLRTRMPFILFSQILLIIGLAVLMTVHGTAHFSAEYFAICLVTMGSISYGIIVVCWYTMNTDGHVQRSLGSAWMISIGNAGGIVSTFAFLKTEAPLYHRGYAICMAMAVLGFFASSAYGFLIFRRRRQLQREGVEGKALPFL